MKLKKIFLNNIGLKLLALLLACVTWFYIEETTYSGSERTMLQKLLWPTEYVAKKLVIQPILVGKVPEGYRVIESEIKASPDSMILVGPPKILAAEEYVYTKPIDLSEYTKTRTLNAELRSPSRTVRFEKTEVQIYLPIESLGTPDKSEIKKTEK